MHILFNIPYLIETYGYIGIFIIVFLESGLFFALPGDSLLFTAGIFASAFNLHLYILIPIIFLAGFLGALAGYELGVNIEKLLHYKFFQKILKKEHIQSTHEFFEEYGKLAVIFSRFVPVARTFTPIVAGVAKMKYGLFVKYSLISALIWSTIITLLGYFLGRIFPHIKDYMSVLVVLVVVVSISPMLVEFFRKKRKS